MFEVTIHKVGDVHSTVEFFEIAADVIEYHKLQLILRYLINKISTGVISGERGR